MALRCFVSIAANSVEIGLDQDFKMQKVVVCRLSPITVLRRVAMQAWMAIALAIYGSISFSATTGTARAQSVDELRLGVSVQAADPRIDEVGTLSIELFNALLNNSLRDGLNPADTRRLRIIPLRREYLSNKNDSELWQKRAELYRSRELDSLLLVSIGTIEERFVVDPILLKLPGNFSSGAESTVENWEKTPFPEIQGSIYGLGDFRALSSRLSGLVIARTREAEVRSDKYDKPTLSLVCHARTAGQKAVLEEQASDYPNWAATRSPIKSVLLSISLYRRLGRREDLSVDNDYLSDADKFLASCSTPLEKTANDAEGSVVVGIGVDVVPLGSHGETEKIDQIFAVDITVTSRGSTAVKQILGGKAQNYEIADVLNVVDDYLDTVLRADGKVHFGQSWSSEKSDSKLAVQTGIVQDFVKIGRMDLANSRASRIAGRYPDDFRALRLLHETFVKLDNLDGALEVLLDRRQEFAQDPYYLLLLADTYRRLGEWMNAKNEYEIAQNVALDTGWTDVLAEATLGVGLVGLVQSDGDELFDVQRKLITANAQLGGSALANRLIAESFIKQYRYYEAINAKQETKSDLVRDGVKLSSLLLEAKKYILDAVRLDPSDQSASNVLYRLGRMLHFAGWFSAARDLYHSYSELDTLDPVRKARAYLNACAENSWLATHSLRGNDPDASRDDVNAGIEACDNARSYLGENRDLYSTFELSHLLGAEMRLSLGTKQRLKEAADLAQVVSVLDPATGYPAVGEYFYQVAQLLGGNSDPVGSRMALADSAGAFRKASTKPLAWNFDLIRLSAAQNVEKKVLSRETVARLHDLTQIMENLN